MMGSASAGKRWYAALRRVSHELGQVVSPDDAALAARGLRTMGVRLAAQTAAAVQVAQWLEAQPQIARVLCPLLPSDSGHALWKRDFTGGCGLFAFVLASDVPSAAARMADALQLFGIGYSWGGYESLALPIAPGGYRSCMACPTGGAPALRLSIGLEDADDLIADLAQALERV
jgi:cystathionine beta-lyase